MLQNVRNCSGSENMDVRRNFDNWGQVKINFNIKEKKSPPMEKMAPKKEKKGLPHGERGPSKEEKSTLHEIFFFKGGGRAPPLAPP